MSILCKNIESLIYEEVFLNPNMMGLRIEIQRKEEKIILQVNKRKEVIKDSNDCNEIINIIENAVKNCNKASKEILGVEMFE